MCQSRRTPGLVLHDQNPPTFFTQLQGLDTLSTNTSDPQDFIKGLGAPVVVKTSGMAAGKGVIVDQNLSHSTHNYKFAFLFSEKKKN